LDISAREVSRSKKKKKKTKKQIKKVSAKTKKNPSDRVLSASVSSLSVAPTRSTAPPSSSSSSTSHRPGTGVSREEPQGGTQTRGREAEITGVTSTQELARLLAEGEDEELFESPPLEEDDEDQPDDRSLHRDLTRQLEEQSSDEEQARLVNVLSKTTSSHPSQFSKTTMNTFCQSYTIT
jgi:hypothetical protein